MASKSVSADIDDLQAWVMIHAALDRDLVTKSVQASETESRNNITTEEAFEANTIVTLHVVALSRLSANVAANVTVQNRIAQLELSGAKDEVATLRAELHRSSATCARLQEDLASEREHSEADRRALLEQRQLAQQDVAALQDELQRQAAQLNEMRQQERARSLSPPRRSEEPSVNLTPLKAQRDDLMEELRTLEGSKDRLTAAIAASREELARAEGEADAEENRLRASLRTLRSERDALNTEIRTANEQLDRLARETTEQKRAVAAEQEVHERLMEANEQLRRSMEAARAAPAPTTSATPPSRGVAGGSPNGDAVVPSLTNGLAALQSVREQLKEMRSSVDRNADGANGSTPHSATRTPYAGGSPQPYPQQGTPQSALSPNGSMVSPWKSRLVKLQGDLRSLRVELGASPSQSSSANYSNSASPYTQRTY